MAQAGLKAKVEPAGFHILGKVLDRLRDGGVLLAVIAEALGHADERIMRKHYAKGLATSRERSKLRLLEVAEYR
jgi:integrase